MRPPCGLRCDGRTCFHTRFIPSTTTRSLSISTRSTRPVLPLSAPVVMTTVSPAFMCRAMSIPSSKTKPSRTTRLAYSNDFRSERNDLHEILVAQFAGDGTEDARPARIIFLVDYDRGVAVEANVAPVRPHRRLLGADHDAADDLAVLDFARALHLLDRTDDHVADRGDFALKLTLAARATKHLDTHRQLGACVVGDVEHCLLLNHGTGPLSFVIDHWSGS